MFQYGSKVNIYENVFCQFVQLCNQNDDLKVLKTKIKRRRIFHFMDVKTILIVGEGMFLFHYQIKFLLSYLLFFLLTIKWLFSP